MPPPAAHRMFSGDVTTRPPWPTLVAVLEQQTPQARQLQLEADQAAADLAESGYDRGSYRGQGW